VAPLTSIEGCVPQFGTGASLYGIETHVKHDVHASDSGGRIDRERLPPRAFAYPAMARSVEAVSGGGLPYRIAA
jgi:hypothetical protein